MGQRHLGRVYGQKLVTRFRQCEWGLFGENFLLCSRLTWTYWA